MKRLIKIVLGTLFTVILLLLAIPLFISADTLKKQVAEQATKATGRQVDIKGKASLTLFPNIAVSVEDVTVGNPAGFRSPYLVHAKTLATGAALRPLLSGNLNVTGITLDGADIQLEQLAGGTKNWEFAKEKAAESADKNAKSSASSAIKSFALGDISIKDSAVKMIKPGETMAVDQINLTVKGADANSPLKVNGSARYKGKTVKMDARLEKMRAFLKNDSSPVNADIELPGGKFHFAGKAQMGDAIAASGKLALDISDVPGLTGWATGKPAKSPKAVSLTADTTISGKKYALKGAVLKVDDLAATGDLTANLEGEVPAIGGTLKFGTLDLNKIVKTARSEPSRGFMDAYAAESTGWSDAPLDLSGLRAVNANLNVTADALKQGNLEVSNIALHPQLSGGNLTLGIDKASLYGGSATGTISASANGGQSVGADLAFNGVKIEPLMTALSGKSRVSGTANMKLNLKGGGNSQRAIVSNLNGTGDVRVADGQIKGINFAQFLRDLKKGFMFDNPSRSTDFTELSGTFTVVQGILSNQDLTMKSPALRLSGKGTVDLPRRSVNYRLVPSIVTSVKGQGGETASGLDVPLNITGSMDNPSIVPDVAGMVQQQLQDPAALKNTLKDIKGTIKNYNSPSDIGKALLGGGKQTAPAATTAPATTAAPATTTPPATQSAPAPQPTPEQQLMEGLGGLLTKKKK